MNEASITQTIESQIRMQCLEIAARTQQHMPTNDIISAAKQMNEFVVETASEIERLRSILRRCMPGADIVVVGGGEMIGLHLRSTLGAAA